MPRPASLSLDLLRTFTTVARKEGDAIAAAQELDINQPSMSKRLRYLQHSSKILPQPWLLRDGKTWRLTERGKEVLPAVQEIVRRYDQLTGITPEESSSRREAVVRFACGQLAATGLAREAAHLFSKAQSAPAARGETAAKKPRLRIASPRGKARIKGVALGSFDLAIVTHDEAAIHRLARRRLHIDPIETDHLTLICSTHLKEWSRRVEALKDGKVKPRDLVGLPLILPEPDAGLRRILDRVFKAEGVLEKLDIVVEIGGWKLILDSVRDRLGVGIVTEGTVRDTKDLIARRLDPAYFRPSEAKLVCRYRLDQANKLDLSETAAAFRTALLQAAKKRETVLKKK